MKVRIPLITNSIQLKQLATNILHSTLSSLNSAFESPRKQDLIVFFQEQSHIYYTLIFLDVFSTPLQKKEKLILADYMAEWYENMKEMFCAKIDLKSAILLEWYGYKGVISGVLNDTLFLNQKCVQKNDSNNQEKDEKEALSDEFSKNDLNITVKKTHSDRNQFDLNIEPNSSNYSSSNNIKKNNKIDFSRLNRLIRIYSIKEDLTMYSKKEVTNGTLKLEYQEKNTTCTGGFNCICEKGIDEQNEPKVHTFALTLKGERVNPYWHCISHDLPLPFKIIPLYLQKIEKINKQKKIFDYFKNTQNALSDQKIANNEISNNFISGDLFDFTLNFFNSFSLRFHNQCGRLIISNEIISGDLNVCFYEKSIENWIMKEISMKYGYLKLRYTVKFVISRGLYLYEYLQNDSLAIQNTSFNKYHRNMNQINRNLERFNINNENMKKYDLAINQNNKTLHFNNTVHHPNDIVNNTFDSNISQTEIDNQHVNTYLFTSFKQLTTFLSTYNSYSFYSEFINLSLSNSLHFFINYKDKSLQNDNILIKNKENEFICITKNGRMLLGYILKYNLISFNELYYNNDHLSTMYNTNNLKTDSNNNLSDILPFFKNIKLIFFVNQLLSTKDIKLYVYKDRIIFNWEIEENIFDVEVKYISDTVNKNEKDNNIDQVHMNALKEANIQNNNSGANIDNKTVKSNIINSILVTTNDSSARIKNSDQFLNFLTFLVIKKNFAKYNSLKSVIDTYSIQFMFYNLNITLNFDGEIKLNSKNILLTNLINNSSDKNTILLHIIDYLRSIKFLIRNNLKPILFTCNYVIYWYGKIIILEYHNQKYYLKNDNQYLLVNENIINDIKRNEVECKLNKIKNKLKYFAADDKLNNKNQEYDNVSYKIHSFITPIGTFQLINDHKNIKISIVQLNNDKLNDNDKTLLETLFFKIFNHENDFVKYLDVLVNNDKLVDALGTLKK